MSMENLNLFLTFSDALEISSNIAIFPDRSRSTTTAGLPPLMAAHA